MNKNVDEIEMKCIVSARIAKKLINMGFIVRDIKPNNTNSLATVFMFEKTPELMKIINSMLADEQEKKFIENWKGKN